MNAELDAEMEIAGERWFETINNAEELTSGDPWERSSAWLFNATRRVFWGKLYDPTECDS